MTDRDPFRHCFPGRRGRGDDERRLCLLVDALIQTTIAIAVATASGWPGVHARFGDAGARGRRTLQQIFVLALAFVAYRSARSSSGGNGSVKRLRRRPGVRRGGRGQPGSPSPSPRTSASFASAPGPWAVFCGAYFAGPRARRGRRRLEAVRGPCGTQPYRDLQGARRACAARKRSPAVDQGFMGGRTAGARVRRVHAESNEEAEGDHVTDAVVEVADLDNEPPLSFCTVSSARCSRPPMGRGLRSGPPESAELVDSPNRACGVISSGNSRPGPTGDEACRSERRTDKLVEAAASSRRNKGTRTGTWNESGENDLLLRK